MNLVFMGTPDFAVPSLKKLIEEHEVKAILTQPDKPKGRGKKMAYSSVKEEALKHNIPVYQPIKLKDDRGLIDKLKEINPDFIIVVAFGQILTKEVLDIPKFGCINLHASLLPMYRGAAPLNWAIIKGEKVSGNTTMLMDVGLDTGDMLLKDEIKITKDMTSGELHDILMIRGADLLIKTIEGLYKGEINPIKQEEDTFYAKMLNKELAHINWTENAYDVNNLVRGLNPWPIAYTEYKGERMKIYKTTVLEEQSSMKPGTIIDVSKEGISVACKENILVIEKVQFPNGKPLTIEQYINGHSIDKNIILGE
ncbi:methionyl-tRNA formyltransferase [Clostridium uliginosum]|uniref:Methionyl-tRNA formyltransferase n=1 Tax=Clostridium uliginosum TaxID=119641 RepID=A0A1I1LH39_9CLOT|nr:methionyl-tRNA formyltransferase [Clostridium uliginosum]SFC72424.1 methionyl-tRNA formyltransferase [Clostridium uliginosum]